MKSPRHRLLARQIRRYLNGGAVPEAMSEWVDAVNEAYLQNDVDRAMLERSLELSSQELLQSNAEMRAVFQALPDQVLRVTGEGQILGDKTARSEEGHFPQRNRVGSLLSDLVPAEVWERYESAIAAALATGDVVSLEYNLADGVGTMFYEARFMPVLGNQVMVVIRNITARKQAENDLREAYSRFEAIIETNPLVAIQGFDQKGHILHWNRVSVGLYGLPVAEALGKPIQEMILDPKDVSEFVAAIEEIWRTGKPAPPREWETRKRNGEKCWVYSSMFPVMDGNRVREVFCIDVDVTERKRLESRLIQSQKMEAIGTLAGGLAHDYNNLLMAIQGAASLILMDMPLSHPHYERLKNIEAQVLSGAELTRQLLGFARGGKGETQSTLLNELLEQGLALFGRMRKEITIEKHFADNLQPVEVDRGQITQVFLNLLMNAWQAMPAGGCIGLETASEKVSAEDDADLAAGEYVRFSVTDTGVGMDERTQARIFDPFFTTKEMGRGTGLGLASAYGIVRNHDGSIRVKSRLGKGSRFDVLLPVGKRPATALQAKKKGGEWSLPALKGRVLLVDDEASIRDVATAMLSALGLEVVTASGAREAISLYEKEGATIDFVLLDIIMPEMGGGAVFDVLKKINPGVRVILSSGYSLDGQAADILQRGCCGFIQKPYNLMNLAHAIEDALSSP